MTKFTPYVVCSLGCLFSAIVILFVLAILLIKDKL